MSIDFHSTLDEE